jgi:Uma2 family endonuclease
MSTILESPPTRSGDRVYDPAQPFGGTGMLRRFTADEYRKLADLGIHDYEPMEGMAAVRRFTVEEYHELIRAGILEEGERVELLDGYLVLHMSHSPAHDFSSDFLEDLIRDMLPPELCMRVQKSITLKKSEPEPDIAVVRGPRTRYRNAHPGPDDILLLIEVAYSSLPTDRRDKARIYAKEGIAEYWVVNVEDRQIEMFAKPSKGKYTETSVFTSSDKVALVLDGQPCGEIAVGDLF